MGANSAAPARPQRQAVPRAVAQPPQPGHQEGLVDRRGRKCELDSAAALRSASHRTAPLSSPGVAASTLAIGREVIPQQPRRKKGRRAVLECARMDLFGHGRARTSGCSITALGSDCVAPLRDGRAALGHRARVCGSIHPDGSGHGCAAGGRTGGAVGQARSWTRTSGSATGARPLRSAWRRHLVGWFKAVVALAGYSRGARGYVRSRGGGALKARHVPRGTQGVPSD